jgi:hypothetical protein
MLKLGNKIGLKQAHLAPSHTRHMRTLMTSAGSGENPEMTTENRNAPT